MTAKKKPGPPEEIEIVEVREPASADIPVEDPGPQKEAPGTWIYVGPTISRTRLVSDRVFRGTRSSVETFLKDELAKHPKAALLIIPVEQLPDALAKIKLTGSILGRTYADLAAGK